MYPSIKFKLVEKAVTWLNQLLSVANQVMGHSCLEFIKFGMGHTLLMFGGVYYECDGDHVIEEKGLKIGGYELVWLVDLVTANLLKNMADVRFEDTTYSGLYCNDGIAIFPGDWCLKEVSDRLSVFQAEIDKITQSEYVHNTAVVCGQKGDSPITVERGALSPS